LIFLLAALFLLFASACLGPRNSAPLRGADPRPVLRVGTVADFPPLAFVRDGKWFGFEADCAGVLAERLGRRLEWRVYPAEGLEPALRSGEIDIVMAGYTVTPGLRATLDFSRPYLAAGLAVLARAGNASHYPTAQDVQAAAVPVGVVRASRAETYARRYLPRADLRLFDTSDAAVAALRDGQTELYLDEAPRLWDIALRDPSRLGLAPAQMDRVEYAWAFPASAPTLREAANQALDSWLQDGTLDLLLRAWIPVTR
jgi:ABC-type amino acid transport substrate-binding protein